MPLYDYKCRSCHKVTEVRHGFKESFDDPCPTCGGEMARVFNPAGIVFKGSGFYINDSRKSSDGDSGKSAESDSGKGGGESAAPAKTDAAAPAASATPPAAPASSKSDAA